MGKRARAFVVAGTHSGAGKTTVTLGIMEALRRRGLTIQPFKAGPDYIDAGHHTRLCVRSSYNLDTWMMGPEGVAHSFARAMRGADIGVVEGVMGLFDAKAEGGSEGGEGAGNGSTAQLAKLLDVPVVLVVNAEGMAGSAAALVSGFMGFDKGVKTLGIIFNRVASLRHEQMLIKAMERVEGARVLGCIPRDDGLKIGERHLGLMTSSDIGGEKWQAFIQRAGDVVEGHVDIDWLLKHAPVLHVPVGSRTERRKKARKGKVEKAKIAVAWDTAFCFYYPENFEVLERFGAEIAFFSPMKDKALPPGTRGIYIGGGYPELHTVPLSRNIAMKRAILNMAAHGVPIYGECGGLMYLGTAIEDITGTAYKMTGVFPWISRMLPRRKSLGYREVVAATGCPFLEKGEVVRGHEYHYSEITVEPGSIDRTYCLRTESRGEKTEGYTYKNTLASYVHLHFASNPSFAKGFMKRAFSVPPGP